MSNVEDKEENNKGVELLKSWLNKSVKVLMSDGRVLVGVFLCTDRDGNTIVGNCQEFTSDPDTATSAEEPRVLGLAMVPGQHIVKLFIDENSEVNQQRSSSPVGQSDEQTDLSVPLTAQIDSDDCM